MRILLVDHDEISLNKIVHRISTAVDTSTMKTVGETHEILTSIIDPEPANTLTERTIARIDELGARPDLILVDLSFDNSNRDGSVQVGRKLAQGLRAYFADLAVGVYSRFELLPRDKGLISSDKFALRLDEFRKMYEHLKDPMTGGDWNDVFEGVHRKSIEEAARLPPVFTISAPDNITWIEGHPYNRSIGFEKAARKLVSLALSYLDLSLDTRIEISQLSGGFSGSFLVKAQIVSGASFVIKVDEDPAKLAKELAGYRKVSARLDHKYYLKPISSDHDPATLTPDWWGAFALPCEVDAKTLLDECPSSGPELASLYRDVWNKCLFSLYGTTTTKKVAMKDLIPKGSGSAAVEGWKSLSRYYERFASLGAERGERVENLLGLLIQKDKEGFHSRKISVPWVEQVHGDLNCRNILYHKTSGLFQLLDFPNVGPNSLAFDFVKAEAELVLIILDWATGRDCDFDRIGVWESLAQGFSQTFIPVSPTINDSEANRIFEGITAIRQLYSVRAADRGEIEQAYLTYLLSRILRYFAYQDLTIAKRHFAFVWASQLAKVLDAT